MDRYELGDVLGHGAFGIVHLATKKDTRQLCAIKQIREPCDSWEASCQMREFIALTAISHSPACLHIVNLYDVIRESNGMVYFVFEYMAHGSLHDLILRTTEKRGAQSELNALVDPAALPAAVAPGTSIDLESPENIASIFRQMMLGLDFIHSKGFVHRDLKPENVLINGFDVKLSDFGLSKLIETPPTSTMTSYVATRWYRAPELILGQSNYAQPVDMFAVGCIIVEVFSLQPLFPGSDEIDQLSRILEMCGSFHERWPEGQVLLRAKGVGWRRQMPSSSHRRSNRQYGSTSSARQNFQKLLPMAPVSAIDLTDALLELDPLKRPTPKEALERFEFLRPPPAPRDALHDIANRIPRRKKLGHGVNSPGEALLSSMPQPKASHASQSLAVSSSVHVTPFNGNARNRRYPKRRSQLKHPSPHYKRTFNDPSCHPRLGNSIQGSFQEAMTPSQLFLVDDF